MYVILTSKPGQFRTEITEGLNPLEAYDYLFYGQKKAHFVIAELVKDDTRIRVVEEVSEIVNNVLHKGVNTGNQEVAISIGTESNRNPTHRWP